MYMMCTSQCAYLDGMYIIDVHDVYINLYCMIHEWSESVSRKMTTRQSNISFGGTVTGVVTTTADVAIVAVAAAPLVIVSPEPG